MQEAHTRAKALTPSNRGFDRVAIDYSEDQASRYKGGDVGWFDRAGTMVEPFAKTAFALKPFRISEVIATQFGLHLILLLDSKPGKDVPFEQVKSDVKEVYCDRLRESLVSYLRQRGKITINPVK